MVSMDYNCDFRFSSRTVLAITIAAVKTFRFQENWINYRTVAEALKKEKHYYNAGAIEYATDKNKKQLFVERVEALI